MLETTAVFRQKIFSSGVQDSSADLENLLEQISLGDRAAFRILCGQVGPKYSILFSRIEKNQDLVRGMLEDVFVSIWRKACLFDRRAGDAKVWLFSIARRHAIECLRRATCEKVGLDPVGPFPVEDPNSESEWLPQGTSSRIRHCLEGMTPDIKKALTLCFSYGLSYDELAAELGVPYDTAKSRIHIGLAELRQWVGASQ